MPAKKKGKTENNGQEPGLIKIRDKWFEDVPDIEPAYWLKEDFSDILQLWDRQKAEELTDLWLQRVEEFIKDLRAKYHKETGTAWKGPFTNVLTTINKWRPYILNYIDCKNRFGLTTTNYFAEHVNKKIKRAKALVNGASFETIRMKVIHGGVMVTRRPQHPLSQIQVRPNAKRQKRSGQENREINPNSNLAQLKQAREDRDETKDLLPKPQEFPGWVSRFKSNDQVKPEDISSVESIADIPEETKVTEKRGKGVSLLRTKSKSKQLAMF